MADLGTGGKVTIGALVLAILTLLTAIVNKNTDLINKMISWIPTPSATFDKAWNDLEDLAEHGKATDLPTIRDKAFDEYSVASRIFTAGVRTADKCKVVRLFSERQDAILVLGLPDDAYSDYEQKAFAESCYKNVETAAGQELYEISNAARNAAYARILNSLEPLARQRDVDRVLSQAARSGDSGWISIETIASDGHYLSRATREAPEAEHPVTIASASDGLPVHEYPRDSPLAGIVGFLPNGSTAKVLHLTSFRQQWSSNNDVWAQVQFVATKPLAMMGAGLPNHLQLTRRVAGIVAMAAPPSCPPFRAHASRHGADQLWVLVGEKPDNDASDAFFQGTSRVNTPCIPRDGQTVRATTDLRVFVGPDPYYPGVRAQGGIVLAGAQFRVVGDVSGYPFDATVNPNFCGGDPPPNRTKTYPAIPAGHEKRYCVYLPISPA